MTTITTGHPRTPLVAAVAAGAALVVGGAIGVAWEQQNTNSPAATHAHTNTAAPFGGATTSNEFSGSIPATRSPGGATTGQHGARVAEYLLLQQLNAKVHNPRVAEYLMLQHVHTGANTRSSTR
jgi:hypothetical protein